MRILLHKMNYRYVLVFICFFLAAVILACIPADNIMAASEIKLYNYTTKENFDYSGAQVNTTLNNNQISNDKTPGIIVNGIALVSYKDVFVKSGLEFDYEYDKPNKTVTLKKAGTTIVMKIGSKSGTVNGKAVTLPVEPVKILYRDSGITNILVPSRFVTETFGYGYTWHKNINTVAIEKKETFYLSYDFGTKFDYKGSLCKVEIDGVDINLGNMPSVITNNTAMLRAKRVFSDSVIGADYKYNKTDKSITLSKDNIKLVMKIGSPVAYINDNPVVLDTPPLIVTNHEIGTNYVMVPGRFTSNSLGYDYRWDNSKMTSIITSSDEPLPDDNQSDAPEEQDNDDDNNNEDNTAPELGDDSVIIDTGQVLKDWDADLMLLYESNDITSLNQNKEEVGNLGYLYYVSRDYSIGKLNSETYMVISNEPFGKITSSINDNELCIQAFDMQSSDYIYQIAGANGNYVNTIATGNNPSSLSSRVTFDMAVKDYEYDLALSDDGKVLYVTICVNGLKKAVIGTNDAGDYLSITGVSPLDINIKKDDEIIYIDICDTANGIGEQNVMLSGSKHLSQFYLVPLMDKIQIILVANDDCEYYISEKDNVLTLSFVDEGNGNSNEDDNNIPIVTDNDKLDKYEIIIPKPKGVESKHITHRDNYYENRFSIKIQGDYTEYFALYPVTWNSSTITDVSVFLNDNYETEFIISTSKLQGYEIVLDKDNIYIHIGNPRDIYKNIVVLDAGHGGSANGAHYFGSKEKDLNLKMIYTLGEKYFNSNPWQLKAYYTRETDVDMSLSNRAAFASKVGADLFVSLHMNASTSSSANGTEVYYSKNNNNANDAGLTSNIMAKILVDTLAETLNTRNRGAVAARYTVVHKNTVPAVLVELGFMSNKNDYAKITDPVIQEMSIKTIYDTLLRIFDEYPTGR